LARSGADSVSDDEEVTAPVRPPSRSSSPAARLPLFLFFHWLFQEEEELRPDRERSSTGTVSGLRRRLDRPVRDRLVRTPAERVHGPRRVVGSTAFFITHGFKENAEQANRS
jgi:hypothetical protein